MIEDKTKIEGYRVWFSLSTGERVRLDKLWKSDEGGLAFIEARKLNEGKVSVRYGRKEVKTVYPTCPKCGHQGESTGERDSNYNGGGEYFRCLNKECGNKWCWS